MDLEQFHIDRWDRVAAPLGEAICPETFYAEVEEGKTMKELVKEAAANIGAASYEEWEMVGRRSENGVIAIAFDDLRTNVSSQAINENGGVAGFVLSNTPIPGHAGQGVYGLKRKGKRLTGKRFAYCSRVDGIYSIPNSEMEGTDLKVTITDREGSKEVSWDLSRL